jgi:hypothetical protein
MLSKTKVLGKLHQLDPTKDYKITQAVNPETFDIENTRQPIRYADLLNSYRNDKERFASHVKPPCAPHRSRRDLTGLFENKLLNDKLLRIFKFRGLAKYCTWNSLTVFYELSNLVPQELEQKLDHLAVFWEELSLLAECPEDIYCDENTPSNLSGLWPLKCESDMGKLRTLEKSRYFFASVTDSDIRQSIVDRIATLNYRVPTLRIVISESSALRQLAFLLKKKLDAIGERSLLRHSELKWKGRRADRYQYWRCFLAAARAQCSGSHGRLIDDLRRIFEVVEPESPPSTSAAALQETSGFRKVSAYPYGIWSSSILAHLFDERALSIGPIICATQPELPVILLLQDFFNSFFKVNRLDSRFRSKSTEGVQYIPFIIDITLKESSSNARDIIWGVLHDVVVDTTEARRLLKSHTGDVRRRVEIGIARPPVRSVYTSIGNARKDESITRGSSVRIDEVRQTHQESTSATNDESHGSEWTASSVYDIGAKIEQEETSGSCTTGETRLPSTSLFRNKINVTDYRSIVEAQKDWAFSEETLPGVNDTESQSGLDECKLKTLEKVLSKNDNHRDSQSQPDESNPKVTAEMRSEKAHVDPKQSRQSVRSDEWPSDDSTLCEEKVDGELLKVTLNDGKEKYAMNPALKNYQASPRAISCSSTQLKPVSGVSKPKVWYRRAWKPEGVAGRRKKKPLAGVLALIH